MKVSVIVPVYNVKDYLEECVRSIAEQTYRELEIILVDDGSTDGSGALCDELCKTDERMRVIHKANGGLSSARNAAMEIAQGAFWLFVDGDDCLELHAIERLIKLHKETNADIATGDFSRVQRDLEKKKTGKVKTFAPSRAMKRMLEDRLSVSACAKLCKRELFDGLRFPEGLIYEDYAIIPKAAARANRIAYVDEYIYYYRPNASSITGVTFNPGRMQFFEVGKEMEAYLAQNFPRLRKTATMRHTKYAISFYKQIGECGFADKEIEGYLIKQIRKNIVRYLFLGRAPLLSKGYGLAIALMPKLAKKVVKK